MVLAYFAFIKLWGPSVCVDRGDQGRDDSEGAGVPQPSRQVQAGRGQEAGVGAAKVKVTNRIRSCWPKGSFILMEKWDDLGIRRV
jgi:hypothetical protein